MSPLFPTAVAVLQSLPGHEQVMALHAALNWSPERLERFEQAEAAARTEVSTVVDAMLAADNIVLLDTKRGLS